MAENRAPKISAHSKQDGLTLEQMKQINAVLASRSSDNLSEQEVAKINSVLQAPGTRSQQMGAYWIPLNHSGSQIMQTPEYDVGSRRRNSKSVAKSLDAGHFFGVVKFHNPTAMARNDYGEYGTMSEHYITNRHDLRERAVAFGLLPDLDYKGQVKNTYFQPVQLQKELVWEDGRAQGRSTDAWSFEPWAQSQFVDENKALLDVTNRQDFADVMKPQYTSDVSLYGWLQNQPISRNQMKRLVRESGVGVTETNSRGEETSPLQTLNLSRRNATAMTQLMEYIQNQGFTYELQVRNGSELYAAVNTGSGSYQVDVLNLNRPSRAQTVGKTSGEGLSVYVDHSSVAKDRTTGKPKSKIGQFKQDNRVTVDVDPTGPLRALTGTSDVKAIQFNVSGTNGASHEDFVNGRGEGAQAKISMVMTAEEKGYGSGRANRVGKVPDRGYENTLITIARNAMTLDSDNDSQIELDEMVEEVNKRLASAGVPLAEVDVENGYAGLPLAAISQLYSRETVISALLRKGIDAEALKDPKYDADVHLVLSDLESLDATAFAEENVSRVKGLVNPEDTQASIRKMGLDDIRLLLETTDAEDEADIHKEAQREFYSRIGYVGEDESVDESDLDEDVQAELADEKNIDTMIVPLKQSLMTAMAGRYPNNAVLKEHLIAPENTTETEQKWLKAIQEKIGSRIGIQAPRRTRETAPEEWEAYEEKLSNIQVVFDDQHVVHWQVTTVDEDGKRQFAKNTLTGQALKGEIGQIFLPDENGLIDLDYTGGSKGHAVAGYNAYFVSAKEQAKQMLAENKAAQAAGEPLPWSKDELKYDFLASEDSLAYRIRLSGFDEELDRRLDQLLTRQITYGINDSLGDNVMLNRLYKGKDTYLTRITNDLVLSDQNLISHLASRVYIDDAYFSDAGNHLLGRKLDDHGQLVDLASKYTPESLSGEIFDETNIAGLGNSHFLSQAALDLIKEGKYDHGRFIENFQEGSAFQKDLALHPEKRFGIMMNQADNKYHYGDPTDRSSMAGNQQIHADSYVEDTHLALMTFKGYTMDDGSLITEDYAERVGREQAAMVADVKLANNDIPALEAVVNEDLPFEKKFSLAKHPTFDGYQAALKEAYIEKMGTTSTVDGGFKLADGDKLSTFHGNKTTISHVISREEMQNGQEFAMFAENPDLEVVMPPESIISRLNMGEIQQLMDGDVKPVTNQGEVVGWQGTTKMINTELKAAHKTHVYGRGDGRRVGAQLLWMMNAREHSDVIIDEIYGNNGRAVMALTQYMEVTGIATDPETGVMKQGLAHSDRDLMDPDYRKDHMITVIDPTKDDATNKMLPKNGGYIKLPVAVHLPNMAEDQSTMFLPVLPEALRQGQELPSGKIIEQDQTRKYKQIVDLIASGHGEDYAKGKSRRAKTYLLQARADSLADEITRAKLGAADGTANKTSHTRRNVMGAKVEHSATASATNNPTLPLDTIEVGPEIYKNLDLKHPDQQVLMWRDPALHAGSVMSFKVKLNENISGVGMNPVIVTPFGGDFDGDSYGIYAPRYSEESQKVLREEYSMEAYLKDMGKNVEDRKLVLTDVELNTGMDFTAGAVKSGVKNSQGETIQNKGMLEDELASILKKGAYQEDSDIAGEINQLWQASQVNNIGGDAIDLRSRETVKQSMIDIAKIGAKGKVELDDEGQVVDLKGLQDNLDRFDRLGYYDGVNENHLYDHFENGQSKYKAEVRDNAQKTMNERYANNTLDAKGTEKILGKTKQISKVAQADREIEKATTAKQLLTATSGQAAIDQNKVAVDIPDKEVSSKISETTQVLTQAALQVKHNAAIVPGLNQGLNEMSNLVGSGHVTHDEFLNTQQKIFDDMGMPEGYSATFASASYTSIAMDPLYGDTKGTLQDVGHRYQSDNMNLTRDKSAVTMASSPVALMAYNGAKYNKQMAAEGRSLYEGNVSGKLVQSLPAAFNQKAAEIDHVDERAGKVTTEVIEQNRRRAQKANRDIRDQSFDVNKPLVKADDLSRILPDKQELRQAVKGAIKTLQDAQVKDSEEDLALETAVSAQFGQNIQAPGLQVTKPKAQARRQSRTGQVGLGR